VASAESFEISLITDDDVLAAGSEHVKLSLFNFFEQGFVASVLKNVGLTTANNTPFVYRACFENVRDSP
jgi:hypothetical protein